MKNSTIHYSVFFFSLPSMTELCIDWLIVKHRVLYHTQHITINNYIYTNMFTLNIYYTHITITTITHILYIYI